MKLWPILSFREGTSSGTEQISANSFALGLNPETRIANLKFSHAFSSLPWFLSAHRTAAMAVPWLNPRIPSNGPCSSNVFLKASILHEIFVEIPPGVAFAYQSGPEGEVEEETTKGNKRCGETDLTAEHFLLQTSHCPQASALWPAHVAL